MSRPLAALLTAAVALATLSAGACGGTTDTVPAEAVLVIDRELPDGGVIFLPAAFSGTEQSEAFQILNQGRATLTISGVSLKLADGGAPGASFPFSQPVLAVDAGAISDPLPVKVGGIGSLKAGELPGAFLQFTYSPKAPGRTQALLVIDSDAPARPRVTATISACAAQADGGGC